MNFLINFNQPWANFSPSQPPTAAGWTEEASSTNSFSPEPMLEETSTEMDTQTVSDDEQDTVVQEDEDEEGTIFSSEFSPPLLAQTVSPSVPEDSNEAVSHARVLAPAPDPNEPTAYNLEDQEDAPTISYSFPERWPKDPFLWERSRLHCRRILANSISPFPTPEIKAESQRIALIEKTMLKEECRQQGLFFSHLSERVSRSAQDKALQPNPFSLPKSPSPLSIVETIYEDRATTPDEKNLSASISPLAMEENS